MKILIFKQKLKKEKLWGFYKISWQKAAELFLAMLAQSPTWDLASPILKPSIDANAENPSANIIAIKIRVVDDISIFFIAQNLIKIKHCSKKKQNELMGIPNQYFLVQRLEQLKEEREN